MADVDGRPVFYDGLLDDLDCAVDSGAEAAGGAKKDFKRGQGGHFRLFFLDYSVFLLYQIARPLVMFFVWGILMVSDKEEVMIRSSGGVVVALAVFSAFMLSGCESVRSVSDRIEDSLMGLGSSKPVKKEAVPAAGTPLRGAEVKLPDHCPRLRGIDELASITQFSTPSKPAQQDMVASATLSGLDATCQVAPNSVTLEISLDFDGALGPVGMKNGGTEANFAYPYFLSVINPQGQILSKDVFALAMVYPQGQTAMHKQDRLRQTIPLMAGQQANQFQIVVGFQLSPEELSYNRSLQSAPKK